MPRLNTIQRPESPEEEKDQSQPKSISGVIQRQETPLDEAEPVPAKSLISAIQRQEAVQEDDEPLQAKPQIQRRSDGSAAADRYRGNLTAAASAGLPLLDEGAV